MEESKPAIHSVCSICKQETALPCYYYLAYPIAQNQYGYCTTKAVQSTLQENVNPSISYFDQAILIRDKALRTRWLSREVAGQMSARRFQPVARQLCNKNQMKIISLAPEVL